VVFNNRNTLKNLNFTVSKYLNIEVCIRRYLNIVGLLLFVEHLAGLYFWG